MKTRLLYKCHHCFPCTGRSNKIQGNPFVSGLDCHNCYNLSINRRWLSPIAKFASTEQHHLVDIRTGFGNLASKLCNRQKKGKHKPEKWM